MPHSSHEGEKSKLPDRYLSFCNFRGIRGKLFCNLLEVNKPFLHIQMSDSSQSAGRAQSGTEHSPFSGALRDVHPHGPGTCHPTTGGFSAGPLKTHNRCVCESSLKHLGLDPGIIYSSHAFQGTNNVTNYKAHQGEDISAQEVLETQEPPLTLLACLEMEAHRANEPPHTMYQISREGQTAAADCK